MVVLDLVVVSVPVGYGRPEMAVAGQTLGEVVVRHGTERRKAKPISTKASIGTDLCGPMIKYYIIARTAHARAEAGEVPSNKLRTGFDELRTNGCRARRSSARRRRREQEDLDGGT